MVLKGVVPLLDQWEQVMKKFAIAGMVGIVFASAWVLQAQEIPKFPKPEKQHEWLQQFVGEWDTESECIMEPGKPAVKCKGTESARSLGGFWVLSEGKGDMMGVTINYVLTLGYDPQKKKYVGTWVDSMTSHSWKYEGSVDADGKVLTLETEGPCPMAPEKTTKFKDVTEFKSKDHRVFTSKMLGDDGKWTTIATVTAHRKKK
jgi:hypothetical protein